MRGIKNRQLPCIEPPHPGPLPVGEGVFQQPASPSGAVTVVPTVTPDVPAGKDAGRALCIMANVAINGLGRIGRTTLKLVMDNPSLTTVRTGWLITSAKYPPRHCWKRIGKALIAMLDALDHFEAIAAGLERRPPVLFLDYDGTLTPIVGAPDAAELAPAMRQRLQRLARRFRVAVISGRDLEDVRQRIGINGLFYTGNHGFTIEGPGKHLEQSKARIYLPALERAEKALHEQLDALPGLKLEHKHFSCAVHYRHLACDQLPEVDKVVASIAEGEGLRRTSGKKVWELQPPIAWDKGRALTWLFKAMEIDEEDVTPFYMGDDITDEDAFRALPAHGVRILVGEHEGTTEADYHLESPDAVSRFFDRLLK